MLKNTIKMLSALILMLTMESHAKMSAYDMIVYECQHGEMKGCYELGRHFQLRNETTKSMQYYEYSCSKGYAKSCMKMGQMYHYGKGIRKNLGKAEKQYRRVLKLDPALGNYLLGMLEQSKSNGSTQQAVKYYDLACAKGESEACSQLAYMHHSGTYIEKNNQKSIAYYKRACAGQRRVCVPLGDAYAKGENGVKKSYLQAKKYYALACDGKSAIGCYRLGNLYYKGNGVKKSYASAKKYYEKSCSSDMGEDGSEKGCNNLAVLYQYGRGVKKDLNRAKKYYRKACKKGYVQACSVLKQ